MSFPWQHLTFWKSGECQAFLERLDDLKGRYTPARRDLWRALSSVPFGNVRVCIVGQDPYPSPKYATGLAFSIPKAEKTFPLTLQQIFKEYEDDLHYPTPKSGDLSPWTDQGVLLWNAIPVCPEARPLSAYDWPEWRLLTEELIKQLGERGIVFCFLGGVAREFTKEVNLERSKVIETSHPSPRGSINAKTPFQGSRIFTRINGLLGNNPINWRL